ncbi:hypothetical protein LINPERHAP2_LOCUS12137, partial [Linum perenne]
MTDSANFMNFQHHPPTLSVKQTNPTLHQTSMTDSTNFMNFQHHPPTLSVKQTNPTLHQLPKAAQKPK